MTNSPAPEGSVERGPQGAVFVSDPSAEAERVAQALRAGGRVVVDVPLSMLVARVAVQRPRVILVDVDGDGALEAVARVRELPDAEDIDILFLGRLGGAFTQAEDALAHEGSGFFPRPINLPLLLQKIEALAGDAPPISPPSRRSSPPAAAAPASGSPRAPTGSASLPPASMRQVEPGSSRPPPRSVSGAPRLSQRPLALDPAMSLAADPSKRALTTPLSSELEQLLVEAEQRVPVQASAESVPPTPEEEIEAVLPAELLEALDLPIEEEDEDEASHEASAPASRVAPMPAAKSQTGVGSTTGSVGGAATGLTGSKAGTGEHPPGAPKTHGGTHPGSTSSVSGTTGAGVEPERSSLVDGPMRAPGADAAREAAPSRDVPTPQAQMEARVAQRATHPPPTEYSGAPPPPPPSPRATGSASEPGNGPEARAPQAPVKAMPPLMSPGDAARAVARAIATRTTGALAIDMLEGGRGESCSARAIS